MLCLMEIQLIRHGESKSNTKEVDVQQTGDHRVELSELGHSQALNCGQGLDRQFIRDALIWHSPYTRTRQTLSRILEGAELSIERDGLLIYEDPRLREVEHGFHGTSSDVEEQQDQYRDIHGPFYYRYKGGESPADCYDRVATFLESMMRQSERKDRNKMLIITHGLTIRCFVMRFLHLTVEQFEAMKNPRNCDVIRIAKCGSIKTAIFSTSNWSVEGIRLR